MRGMPQVGPGTSWQLSVIIHRAAIVLSLVWHCVRCPPPLQALSCSGFRLEQPACKRFPTLHRSKSGVSKLLAGCPQGSQQLLQICQLAQSMTLADHQQHQQRLRRQSDGMGSMT